MSILIPCDSNDNIDLFDLSNGLGLSSSSRQSSSQNKTAAGCRQTVKSEEDHEVMSGNTNGEKENIASTSPATFLSCKASNSLELLDGASSSSSANHSTNIERIELAYNYNIYTTNNSTDDLLFSISVFELDLLKAVANEFGLISCAFSSRRRSLVRNRKLNNTNTNAVVVGIGSNPSDVVDITRDCVDIIVSTTVKATTTTTTASCTSMIGFMSAWVEKTTETDLVKKDIYTTIENYSNGYTTDEGVLALTYINIHDPSNSTIMTDSSSTELVALGERFTITPSYLASIVLVSVVAVLAAFAFFVTMKRKYGSQMNLKDSQKSRHSQHSTLVVVGSDGDEYDDAVLEIIFEDNNSDCSTNTEHCTAPATAKDMFGLHEKHITALGGSMRDDEPFEDEEGVELSYDPKRNSRIHIG